MKLAFSNTFHSVVGRLLADKLASDFYAMKLRPDEPWKPLLNRVHVLSGLNVMFGVMELENLSASNLPYPHSPKMY